MPVQFQLSIGARAEIFKMAKITWNFFVVIVINDVDLLRVEVVEAAVVGRLLQGVAEVLVELVIKGQIFRKLHDSLQRQNAIFL